LLPARILVFKIEIDLTPGDCLVVMPVPLNTGLLEEAILFVLRPDGPILFHSMKSIQKSRQNNPSAGRFPIIGTRLDGLHSASQSEITNQLALSLSGFIFRNIFLFSLAVRNYLVRGGLFLFYFGHRYSSTPEGWHHSSPGCKAGVK